MCMAKRRTRKQKRNAKHNIKITWEPKEDPSSGPDSVKSQNASASKKARRPASDQKRGNYTANSGILASIKKDIVKSLSLAGLILGLEMMIYLFL